MNRSRNDLDSTAAAAIMSWETWTIPSLQCVLHGVLLACLSIALLQTVSGNQDARPCNQLSVSGNACGPAALINAYRFGDKKWQQVGAAIDGETDREQIMGMIRGVGMRPSASIPGRARWTRRGVNLADLRDMGSEMAVAAKQPKLKDEMFFLLPGETPEKLLHRTHRRLAKSIDKGLPPVLSLRRHALRRPSSGEPTWMAVDSHFVTLIALPHRLQKGERSFPVRYVDPWGGVVAEGWIRIPVNPQLVNQAGASPFLEAWFPAARVGRDQIRKGETTMIALAAAVGGW